MLEVAPVKYQVSYWGPVGKGVSLCDLPSARDLPAVIITHLLREPTICPLETHGLLPPVC